MGRESIQVKCQCLRPEFDIKASLGAPLLIFPRDYILKLFHKGIIQPDSRGFKSVVPLLGELPKAIEPHLPFCQLFRWQLDPSKWSSPTTKLLDAIIVTVLLVGFPAESLRSTTGGFACNCPMPEAWTMELSGLN